MPWLPAVLGRTSSVLSSPLPPRRTGTDPNSECSYGSGLPAPRAFALRPHHQHLTKSASLWDWGGKGGFEVLWLHPAGHQELRCGSVQGHPASAQGKDADGAGSQAAKMIPQSQRSQKGARSGSRSRSRKPRTPDLRRDARPASSGFPSSTVGGHAPQGPIWETLATGCCQSRADCKGPLGQVPGPVPPLSNRVKSRGRRWADSTARRRQVDKARQVCKGPGCWR